MRAAEAASLVRGKVEAREREESRISTWSQRGTDDLSEWSVYSASERSGGLAGRFLVTTVDQAQRGGMSLPGAELFGHLGMECSPPFNHYCLAPV